jgi:aspartate 1-decarboxylase
VIANGPAARLLQRGGKVIITYTQLTDGKPAGYQPQIVTQTTSTAPLAGKGQTAGQRTLARHRRQPIGKVARSPN